MKAGRFDVASSAPFVIRSKMQAIEDPMTRFLKVIALVIISFSAAPIWAQTNSWIQIEARPTEAIAVERAQAYAARLPDVSGFQLRSGWFAITLGPYPEAEAEARLAQLRATGAIPADSYLTDEGSFFSRFYGFNLAVAEPAAPAEPVTLPEPGEETPQQALVNERRLTRENRQEVQLALQASGFYNSVVDADFGPGTRRAMRSWQTANGFEATGVMTSLQRRDLLDTYRDALTTLGLEDVTDTEAGVSIALPLGMVSFDRYEPPFAHFESTADLGPKVLLISQAGDRATLTALYDILQTLEIMPLDGPRNLNRSDFTLTGQNEALKSHAYARLSDGAIKGYVMIWPVEDSYRGALALSAMQASFVPTEGVLPDSVGAPQNIDLLAGLRIRKPERAVSGFYVSADGSVLTSASAVQNCQRLEIGGDVVADIVANDPDKDLALLRAASALSPISYARLTAADPRLQSDIAVAGFSFGGVLTLPSVTFGTLADVRGLDGDESVHRLALLTEAGDTGGPVFDASGAVTGMLLPEEESSRVLPGDVAFARDAEGLSDFLSANGVRPSLADGGAAMAPEDLATLAADMTVLVTCWN